MVALILVAVLLLGFASGIPVALALLLGGIVAFWAGEGGDGLNFTAGLVWGKTFSYSLSALPLFVLMGYILLESGFVKHLFRTLGIWVGRVPGSLAVIVLATSAVFAAMSGSGSATAATVGTIVRPEATRYGYKPRLLLGALNAGADLAPLIPPSIALIVYASLTESSIIDLFAAGVVPGLLVFGLMVAYVVQLSIRKPELAPPYPAPAPGERLATLWVWLVLGALVFLSIGGLLLGWYTPTEAAAIGVAASSVLLLASKKFNLRDSVSSIWLAVRRATTTSAFIILLIAAGFIFSHTLTFFGFPQRAAAMIAEADLEVWQLMAILTVALFVLGMFVDSLTMQVITVPFLLPTLIAMNIDLVWFGIYLVLMIEIGTNTPPFGIHLFVLQGVMGATYRDAVMGAIPFSVIWLLVVILILLFPAIVTWLPSVL